MISTLFQKIALPALAAAAAAGGSLVARTPAIEVPAYDLAARSLEASDAAHQAERAFDKADHNKDGYLSADEYAVLGIVSAELARLNGFIAIDTVTGVRTVSVPKPVTASLSIAQKAAIRDQARSEYEWIAGDDLRLTRSEFVDSKLEEFISIDADRNGILTGPELSRFAYAQSKLAAVIG